MTETAKLLALIMRELESGCATADNSEGWLSTRALMPVFGMRTIGSAREIADRLVAAGFAQRKRGKRGYVMFRLSDSFKTWADAVHTESFRLVEKVPAGWMSLAELAHDLKRTVRGLQYIATQRRIPFKVYRTPRATRYYQRSKFDV